VYGVLTLAGLVVIDGAVIRTAANSDDLYRIFEEGSSNRLVLVDLIFGRFMGGRHIAATKMNATSSRSHLIIGIVIESTNLMTGAVVQGKLSLVDLAGYCF
jgi:hypothetical protein